MWLKYLQKSSMVEKEHSSFMESFQALASLLVAPPACSHSTHSVGDLRKRDGSG